jgi:HTH-type transcriptional regulator/antitoxin HigA
MKGNNNIFEYAEALARLEEVWGSRPGDINWDERCTLVDQIIIYEEENFPIPLPDPVDAILFRMEQGGLEPKDLIPFIGTEIKVLEVLSRQKELSKDMILKLQDGLDIFLDSPIKEKEND